MADTPGDPGEQAGTPDAAQSAAIGAATASSEEAGGIGDPSSDEQGLTFSGVDDSLTGLDDRGFFGGIMDSITGNPVASGLQAIGMLTGVPALGIMGLMAHAGKALGGTPGSGLLHIWSPMCQARCEMHRPCRWPDGP